MKVKKTGKTTEKILAKTDPNAELLNFVNSCHQSGDDYRRKFKTNWDKIEEQIRCQHPTEWEDKEDWQTKVFIPQQTKTQETAAAYLDKMLFGQKRFFAVRGVEQRDKEEEGYIMELYDNVFDRGGFSLENDFVLNEASSGPGTSFIKILVNPNQTGLQFIWRSAYNITIDPKCGNKLSSAKFICDDYEKNIVDLINDVDKPGALYTKEAVQNLIDKAQEMGRSKTDEALATIKGIDGTDVQISKEYLSIKLVEFWGWAKISKVKDNKTSYTYENRIITIANGTVILRNVENDYGIIPIFGCRIKPRKYDYYGLGFCHNTVDLQDLTNSMINLGFDSLKMCSMDIALIDATKIKDPASIEYRPMATWMLKGNVNEAVKLGRQGISALNEIMRGLALLDQFQQEATGVLRQIQGAPEVSGASSETLGEYQAKLAMIDNRFLKIARFIERDYIEPMLTGIFKILFNPKFFSQALIDRIIGMKEVNQGIDPMTGQPIKAMAPKIDFNKLSQITEMGYDFKAVGMTQFTKMLDTLQKLKELILTVVKTPQLMILFKIEELVKRTLQAMELQDYQDLLKSDEEIKTIMSQIYAGQSAQPGAEAPMQGV